MRSSPFGFRRKLTLLSLGTATLALLMAGAGFLLHSRSYLREAVVNKMQDAASLMSMGAGTAIEFSDDISAEEDLATFGSSDRIMAAAILLADGEVFARYTREGVAFDPPTIPDDAEHTFMKNRVELFHPLVSGGERVGTVYILRDLDDIAETQFKSAGIIVMVLVASLLITLLAAGWFQRFLTRPINILVDTAAKVSANRDYTLRAPRISADELGDLTDSFNQMLTEIGQHEAELDTRVKERTQELENQNAIKTQLTELHDSIRGELEPDIFCRNVLRFLCPRIDCPVGAFYMTREDGVLGMSGSYAYGKSLDLAPSFRMGEGVIGQAAVEQETLELSQVPDDYFKVGTGLGDAPPRVLLVCPVLFEGHTTGVIELGSLNDISPDDRTLLDQGLPAIAMGLHSAVARQRTRLLLERTQAQAEELQQQQEELRVVNEELEEQTRALRQSQEQLQAQQEELQVTNEELEEQKQSLQQQKAMLEETNRQVEHARKEIQEKAAEVEKASRYKSEFLANMSHELRTPLNSLLILSRMLFENKGENLTEKQVQYSKTIHQAGSDLLDLINDVLDLSKVEAGKLDVYWEDTEPQSFLHHIENTFRHMVEAKGLDFIVTLEAGIPERIRIDRKRVEQIVKNLLSNATKFCAEGHVAVTIGRPPPTARLTRTDLDPRSTVAVAISDTGIGIPEEKQEIIFNAFQQADGTTSRNYGGTGLGLSISTELARLLGGEIQLESEESKGSTFTLYLPEVPPATATQVEVRPQADASVPTMPAPAEAPHDAPAPAPPGERTMLIIEDDPKFAMILGDLAEAKGFETLLAADGETGLELAAKHLPSAILLDLKLPGLDGLGVMQQLKADPATLHIPIHIISAMDEAPDVMNLGAIGYLQKPVHQEDLQSVFKKIEEVMSTRVKELLVVEDSAVQRQSIEEMIGDDQIRITGVATGEEAYELLKDRSFDCLILDLGLKGDISGFGLLERMAGEECASHPPVVVYTGKDLSREEEEKLRRHTQSIVIKGAKSPERLLDEVTLFLHRVETDLPERQRRLLKNLHKPEVTLDGKTVLLVDDDMRNVFALSSALEDMGIEVVVGKNGIDALQRLKERPDVDLVLMDIMMPEMDGYEATGAIRAQKAFANLPIIALTAKAMKGDRDKCIAAGASDYLAKPVDMDRLVSLLHVWLHTQDPAPAES